MKPAISRRKGEAVVGDAAGSEVWLVSTPAKMQHLRLFLIFATDSFFPMKQ